MSREKIIQVAASQLNVKENPPGSNKTIYGKWYGFDGYAWCAMFVSWVYDQAAHPLGKINDAKGFRSCQAGFNHWKSTGEIITDPQIGDIVLFDWEGDGVCNHTGIFHEWIGTARKEFYSYEGNTAVGDDSDGGCVMRRKRSVKMVKAFVSPKILSGANTTPPDVSNVLKTGSAGSDVLQLQKQLKALGFNITADGDFGKETEKAVKQFQKANKFEASGEVDLALKGFVENKTKESRIPADKLTTGAYLQKGNSGEPVVQLQKALNKKGAAPKLEPDGDFGTATEKAVKQFQKASGLKTDGIAGPLTLKALGIN